MDEATNAPYTPAIDRHHNGGLFLVGVEATGMISASALNHADGSFTRVASFSGGFPAAMDVVFDAELQQRWAVGDDTCSRQMTVHEIAPPPPPPCPRAAA